jgi:hypothetical protein
VVCVRFNDLGNLTSCETFLQHAFPGTVERDGDVLTLTFRIELAPAAERNVVERLLWAWRTHDPMGPEDGFVVEAGEPESIR